MSRCADVTKESGVIEDADYGLTVHNNVRRGYGVIVLVGCFGTPAVSDTPVRPSRCGEGGFQVAPI